MLNHAEGVAALAVETQNGITNRVQQRTVDTGTHLVKKHNLPLTKIVDDIMEQKQGKYNDEYKYLDPKILRGNEGGQIPRTKTTFNDSIVFVVGGGNYIEYQNLQDYVKNKNAGHTSSACKSILTN